MNYHLHVHIMSVDRGLWLNYGRPPFRNYQMCVLNCVTCEFDRNVADTQHYRLVSQQSLGASAARAFT